MDHDEMDDALRVARNYRTNDGDVGRVSKALLDLHRECTRPFGARNGDRPDEQPRLYGLVMARQTWLEDTERIQREVFKLAPDTIAYLRDQVLACTVELAECIQEVPWKSARDGILNQGDAEAISATVKRDAVERAQKELIDALHFLANAAVALGLDDASLWDQYNTVTCANVEKRRRQEVEAATWPQGT